MSITFSAQMLGLLCSRLWTGWWLSRVCTCHHSKIYL